MKIIYYCYSPVMGGTLKQAMYLSAELKRRGYPVACIFNKCEEVLPAIRELEQVGISCYRAAVEGKKDIQGLIAFCRILIREKPDVLHFHLGNTFENVLPITLSHLLRIKVIVTEQLPFFSPQQKRFALLTKKISTYCSDRIILLGESIKHRYIAHFQVPSSKIATLPNCAPSLPQREIKKVNTLGFLGEFTPRKSVDSLIKIVPDLVAEGYHFVFCGKGPLAPQLYQLRQTFKNQISVMEFTQNPYRFYEQIDALLLLSEEEGLPLVILEAVACGIPVISTDVGVTSEYFPHGNGVLYVEERETGCLLRQLTILKDLVSLQNMIQKGQERFTAALTPSVVTDQLITLYEDAIRC